MLLTARQLCEILGGELDGDPDVEVSRPSKIEDADEGSLTFLANPKYEHYVYKTKASVLLVNKDFKPSKPLDATLIRVSDVYQSLGLLLNSFNGEEPIEPGISELAYVHESAELGDNVTVGPFSFIGPGSKIGEGVVIYPQVYVGQNVRIGDLCKVYAGVKIYHDCEIDKGCVIHSNSVLGSDGFGFAKADNGEFSKIAQVGNVVIEENVEIGANTVIDRATMGSTRIKKGAKLDNLIQIAHNVEIGENSAMAAQSGVAGSTKVGKNVLLGGQVGVAGHIRVSDGAQVAAQTGINTSVKNDNERLMGSPAMAYMDYLKAYSVFRKLPELQEKINQLQREIDRLSAGNEND